MVITKRKIIKQGNNTLTITLPREWTSKYGIKQYMVDIFEPGYSLTVMEFSDIARGIISDRFFMNKKIPLIVGGSGLYIKSIIDDLDRGPGKDPDFRNKIEEDIDSLFEGNSADVGIFLSSLGPNTTQVEVKSLSSVIADYTAMKLLPQLQGKN